MKPKQSEDEKLFRINGYSYRFVGGEPGVRARRDGLDGRGVRLSIV
jgi:hypothetical protein